MVRPLRLLFLLMTIAMLARTAAATGTTFTITSTADAGAGTLRQALLDASGTPTPWTFNFNIPGAGPHTITLASALPFFGSGTPCVIDGYSQPGSSPNASATSDNAVLKIIIDGSAVGSAISLAGNVTLKGVNYLGYIGLYNSNNAPRR